MTSSNTSQSTDWSLVALTPALGDLSVPLGVSTSVGRHADNDIVLATQQISRQHAKFNQIGSTLVLQDLGSSNGTFVNGERIGTEAVELEANDEVAFADILFVVAHEAENNALNLEEKIGATPTPSQIKTTTEAETNIEPLTEVVSLPATVVAPLDNTRLDNLTPSKKAISQIATSQIATSQIATTQTPEIANASHPKQPIAATIPVQATIQPTVKTEIVPTEPEVVKSEEEKSAEVKLDVVKPTADTTLTPTAPTSQTILTPPAENTPIKHTITEQATNPITPIGSTASHPTTPTKQVPTQTWLVAIVIVILIVLAIIGTLFLK